MRTRWLLSLTCLAALSGCFDPDLAGPGDVDAAPVAIPEARTGRVGRGTLLVSTYRFDGGDDWGPERRGYAVFDRSGKLVYTTRGFSSHVDRTPLEPGRYVVTSLVGDGLFDRHIERRVVLVEAGHETRVDFESPVEPALP